ncbi:MAG: hypothetical protein CM15mP74_32160 [Halieaceae bacterium]|nr:MAG: hypothetical protein CM15mP74_32160 [Halieaceae bacterium]
MEMLVPDTYPNVAAKLQRLITPHPAKQWTDELVLERGGWEGLKPTYIHCVGQTYRKSSDLMVGPARGPDWTFIELDIRGTGCSRIRISFLTHWVPLLCSTDRVRANQQAGVTPMTAAITHLPADASQTRYCITWRRTALSFLMMCWVASGSTRSVRISLPF